MPRFFFNISSSTMTDEGIELPDPRAARSEAIRAAGEMLADIDGGLDGEEWAMKVTDEAGQPVLTLRFSVTEHRPK